MGKAGGVVVALLAAVAAVIVLLWGMAPSVEGTITARGERFGSFELEPTRCRSGQPFGYFGVELVSSAAPEHKLRLIRDPVEGPLVAYERAGQSGPVVLRAEDCRHLDVQVLQTNTRVNEVFVLRGSARIDCEELEGAVTFGGCS